MNFDLEEVQPFLNRLSSSVLDSGFTADEITAIEAQLEKMNKDNEIRYRSCQIRGSNAYLV